MVVFEINKSVELSEEMKRLNDSFGIGIIELKANPFESKVLFQSKLRKLDFKTIDKLCKVNKDYENFISINERILTIDEKTIGLLKKSLRLRHIVKNTIFQKTHLTLEFEKIIKVDVKKHLFLKGITYYYNLKNIPSKYKTFG